MQYYIQQLKNGSWIWYLLGDNNEHLASAARAYGDKQECYRVINLVKASANIPIVEV